MLSPIGALLGNVVRWCVSLQISALLLSLFFLHRSETFVRFLIVLVILVMQLLFPFITTSSIIVTAITTDGAVRLVQFGSPIGNRGSSLFGLLLLLFEIHR